MSEAQDGAATRALKEIEAVKQDIARLHEVDDSSGKMAAFNPQYLETVERVAEKLARSGMFPNRTKDQLAVIIMQGHELGLGTMQAANGLYVIGGRAALRAELAVSLVLNSGKAEYFCVDPKSSPTSVTAMTKRVGAPREVTLTWTMEDAKRAGINNPNYQKYPQRMLEARASMALARQVYPDVLMGLYSPEELEPNEEPVRARVEPDEPQSNSRVRTRVTDGPAAVPPPVSTRAASSEPSNGGATLHVPDPLHDSPEARDRMLREIRRLIKEIGADHCKELITPLGLPPVAQANAHELNRIVTALLAEGTRLDCLSVFQWKSLAKEIGPKAAEAIVSQVSTEPGQAPEDWDWHQLDRAIKAAKRLTAGEAKA